MTYDVFISYSHKDKAIKDVICHHFENEKMKCWMAPRDITPGADWAESIAQAIPECKIFLLIFSSHSNMSKQVLREVQLAVSNNLIIIPAKIEDIQPTDGMSYYLSTVHWIDVVNEKIENKIKILSTTVSYILSSSKNQFHEKKPITISTLQKKRNMKWARIVFPVVVVIASSMLFVFRDSIFNGDTKSMATSTATKEASTATMELTFASTSEITPSPALTYDPNASLDMVVNIPDISLKSAIIDQLEFQGITIEGNITVADMHKLEGLVTISSSEKAKSLDKVSEENPGFNVASSRNDIETLEGLQYAKNLKTLVITDLGIKDISVLSHISNLEKVDMILNNIEDISPLAKNINLKEIDLDTNMVSDIGPLAALSNMEYIVISGNDVTDISPLAELKKLKSIGIAGNNVTDLSPLATLYSLEHLTIADNPISSISVVQNLPNLRTLFMWDVECTDASEVLKLDYLETLMINGTNIILLSPLLEFDNLQTLVIDKTIEIDNDDTIKALKDRGCLVVTVD